MLERTVRMNILLDFYGDLLTDKQNSVCMEYFEEDYSLGEISRSRDVSRQAIHDLLNRARQHLEQYEDDLGLVESFRQNQERIDLIREWAENQQPPGPVVQALSQLDLTPSES